MLNFLKAQRARKKKEQKKEKKIRAGNEKKNVEKTGAR